MKQKVILFILLCLLCFSKAWAQDITQNQTLDNALASMFQFLDLDSVKTGFLLDRAVEAVDIRKFNGTLTNDNYVDLMSFRNTLITLNSAIVNSAATSFDGNAITNSLYEQGVVNLGVAAFKYNYIANNALTDNLISYQNGVVDDVFVNGTWQNPYSDDYAFVFTTSVPETVGSNVTFRLAASQLLTNLDLTSVEFDNGSGVYQTISIPYEISYNNYSAGDKHLRLRLTLSDNTVLESHAVLTVLTPGGGNNVFHFPPIDFEETFSTTSNNQQISAVVTGISKHSGGVVKPFVFVEGFDDKVLYLAQQLLHALDSSQVNNRLSIILNAIIDNYGQFDFDWFYNNATALIANNYDIFYVDFNNPGADIRDNALLLQSALEWINSLKEDGAERNIVMGYSMGGLIARYALCDMEANLVPHETAYYISFDSPHMGANLPLGLQYAFRDIYSVLCGDSSSSGLLAIDTFDPATSYLMNLYSSPSVKQMLYYHVDSNGCLNSEDHVDWQETLDVIGFPRGDMGYSIDNISIVNGGEYDSTDDCLLDLNLSLGNGPTFSGEWTKWFLVLFTHASNLNLSIQAYRNDGAGGTVEIAQGQYTKRFSWTTGAMPINLFGQSPLVHTSPGSSEPLDYINSSTLSYGDCNPTVGSDYINVSFPNPIPFVPASSALAIPESVPFSLPLPHTQTPFDVYYYNGTAHSHSFLGIYNSYFTWINTQVNSSMSGPKGVVDFGDIFSVNAPTGYNNPSWSFSEPSSFSINNNVATFVGSKNPIRAISIIYRDSGVDAKMAKHRTVLTDYPEMITNVRLVGANSYEITASCTSAHAHLQSVVDSLAADGSIKYVWGRKINDGNITWSDTTSTRSYVCTAYVGDITRIYMKLYCGPTLQDPDPVFAEIDRRTNIQFFYDPKETAVHYIGIQNYTQVPFPLFTTGYLVLWHNSDYNGTPVAPDNIKIGNTVIPLTTTSSASINGETKTVYCFSFMSCSEAQAALASASADYLAGNHWATFLRITIRNGNTVLQHIDYPFIPLEN